MIVKMQDALGSFGVKKALPFTKFLNYELNKLRGSGVLQNALAVPKQNCPLDENPMPIIFSKMIFLFTVFVLGGALSIITFIFERALSNTKDCTLEKINGKAVASRGPRSAIAFSDFSEIDNLSILTHQEFQSFLQNWMERNATRSKEELLKILKLEVDSILVGIGQSVVIGTKKRRGTL
jgi:hypothetical protein